MKLFLKSVILLLCTLNSSLFAAIPDDGWYFGLFISGADAPQMGFTLSTSQLTLLNNSLIFQQANLYPTIGLLSNGNGRVKYGFGGGVGGQFGYRWCGFRLEGELLFLYNSYNRIGIDGGTYSYGSRVVTSSVSSTGATVINFPYSMSGHLQVSAGFVNLLYDFYNHTALAIKWIPYVGAGVGFGHIQNKWIINLNQFNSSGNVSYYSSVIHINAVESSALVQGIAGISYLLDDYFSVGADYRYITTKLLTTFNNRLALHTININFNYWFSG